MDILPQNVRQLVQGDALNCVVWFEWIAYDRAEHIPQLGWSTRGHHVSWL